MNKMTHPNKLRTMKSFKAIERRGREGVPIDQKIEHPSMTKKVTKVKIKRGRRADLVPIVLKRASQNLDSAITWVLLSFKTPLKMMLV